MNFKRHVMDRRSNEPTWRLIESRSHDLERVTRVFKMREEDIAMTRFHFKQDCPWDVQCQTKER